MNTAVPEYRTGPEQFRASKSQETRASCGKQARYRFFESSEQRARQEFDGRVTAALRLFPHLSKTEEMRCPVI